MRLPHAFSEDASWIYVSASLIFEAYLFICEAASYFCEAASWTSLFCKSVTWICEAAVQEEDYASLCRVADIAIAVDDLKRLAIIAGFKIQDLS